MNASIVIMGVAGCGKSSLGQAVAQALGCPLVEGDDFHSPASRAKMSQGIALTDADRAGWLAALGAELQRSTTGQAGQPSRVVLTCSALKRAYRDQLRAVAPGLRFAFLAITQGEAQRRVEARSATHFFSANLVANQFATLEPPVGEAGVLALDANSPLPALQAQVLHWLGQTPHNLGQTDETEHAA